MNPQELHDAIPGSLNMVGLYAAIVEDVDDPDRIGRVRARVEGLHDHLPINLIPWSMACMSPSAGQKDGTWDLPAIGSSIWVMFRGANPQLPVWVGSWPGLPGDINEADAEVLSTDAPEDIKIIGVKGHRLVMNKNPKDSNITIKSSLGAKVEISDRPKNKKITLETASGDSIVLDETNGKIKILSALGYSWEMNTETGEVSTVAGSHTETIGSLSIAVDGTAEIKSGGEMKLQSAGTMKINAAADRGEATIGSEFKSIANKDGDTNASQTTILRGHKSLLLLLGDHLTEIVKGKYEWVTKLGSILLKNLLASIEISKSGGVTIKNTIGEISLSKVGAITAKNAIASISVDPVGNITISAGPVLRVKATGLVILQNGKIPVNNYPVCSLTGLPHNIGNPQVLA